MLKNRIVGTVFILALVLHCRCAWAQGGPGGGLYEIVSGRYSACCGFIGIPTGYDLPSKDQKFVRFSVNAENHTASMTFLGQDARTVFSTVPCLTYGAIQFSFNYGLIFQDRVIFHVDPSPPPYGLYWNYTVSNSPSELHIDGLVGTALAPCADVPTHFMHSIVVAVLHPAPRLQLLQRSKEGATRLMVQGTSGWTHMIEASTDLAAWTPISTNFMNFSLCPICPFAIVEDSASTKLPHRFYRAVEVP